MSQARDFADSFSAVSTGRRNMIINGAMQVAQRGTSSTSDNYQTVDRFRNQLSNLDDATVTQSQSSESPDGFSNSYKMTVGGTAESALAADELVHCYQVIEAQNLQHLKYGTSAPLTTTLSFWVRSSITGTYACHFLRTDTSNRARTETYTINSADTWEYKTITIDGDTTNTIANDTGQGLSIYWVLAAGTNFTSTDTSGSWAAYDSTGFAYGQTANVVGTANATWQITGVQLELGNSASPFEHRSYGEELALCQRYFLRFQRDGSNDLMFGRPGFSQTNAANRMGLDFPNVMRVAPTYSETDLYYWDGVSTANLPTPSTTRMHKFSFDADYAVTGITTNRPLWFYFNSASTHLSLDAEL